MAEGNNDNELRVDVRTLGHFHKALNVLGIAMFEAEADIASLKEPLQNASQVVDSFDNLANVADPHLPDYLFVEEYVPPRLEKPELIGNPQSVESRGYFKV